MISPEGERAMDACADKAERVSDYSSAVAQAAILAELSEGPKTGEVLVWKCKDRGIVPHDDRAFGSAFSGLARRGLITKVGYGPRHKGHGTSGAIVWALT